MFFQLRKDNRSVEYQLQRENPIAVFDSGVGGISVLRELIRIVHYESLPVAWDVDSGIQSDHSHHKQLISLY